MGIFVIKGAAKTGKTFLANALRNTHNIQKKGPVLLLDEDTTAHPLRLLEKLLAAPIPLEGVTIASPDGNKDKARGVVNLEDAPGNAVWDVDDLTFKPGEPLIVVVGDKGRAMLDRIEKWVPGFQARMGSTRGVTTELLS